LASKKLNHGKEKGIFKGAMEAGVMKDVTSRKGKRGRRRGSDKHGNQGPSHV